MAVFSYKGFNSEGEEVKGVIEASSKNAAYSKLRKIGIYPYEIEEEKGEKGKSFVLRLKKGPTPKELIVFLRTLSTLIDAGIPIVDAVESFTTKGGGKLTVFYKLISSKLKEGKSLSQALFEAGVKDRVVINLVSSGEKSGLLSRNLVTAAEIIEKREALKSKLIQALIYPSILLIVSFGVVTFMMSVVIPKVITIYKTAKLSLPKSTKLIVGLSQLITNNYPILLSFLALILTLTAIITKKKRGSFDNLKLKLPVFGNLILYIELQRFLETLGKLLTAGIPLIESFKTAIETINNLYLRKELSKVMEKVEKGGQLYSELASLKEVPQVVVQLVKAGEKSGNLGQMCEKASNYLKGEVEFQLQSLTSLIEPATMLIVGLIIGFIVYSLLLPIVSISTVRPL